MYKRQAKNGDNFVRNSAANIDAAIDREALPNELTSPRRTDTKPPVPRRLFVRTFSSSSQSPTTASVDKISTDTATNSPTKSDDKVKAVEFQISDTLKHTETSSARDFQQSNISSKTEQASSISKTSRLPRRLNQTALGSLNDTVGQRSDTTSVDTGATGNVNPLDVKPARTLHSVPPVVPVNIRSTGVATPAVQAQKLAFMKGATGASHIATELVSEPQTTSKQQTENTVEHSQTSNISQLPRNMSKDPVSRPRLGTS